MARPCCHKGGAKAKDAVPSFSGGERLIRAAIKATDGTAVVPRDWRRGARLPHEALPPSRFDEHLGNALCVAVDDDGADRRAIRLIREVVVFVGCIEFHREVRDRPALGVDHHV